MPPLQNARSSTWHLLWPICSSGPELARTNTAYSADTRAGAAFQACPGLTRAGTICGSGLGPCLLAQSGTHCLGQLKSQGQHWGPDPACRPCLFTPLLRGKARGFEPVRGDFCSMLFRALEKVSLYHLLRNQSGFLQFFSVCPFSLPLLHVDPHFT